MIVSQQLAQLTFTAIGTNSIVLPLSPENLITVRTNGETLPTLSGGAGRITIIAEQPMLNALLSSNQHSLLLFGVPGQTYQLETTTNLADNAWEFLTNVTLTNIVQPVEGRSNSPTMLFYHARE